MSSLDSKRRFSHLFQLINDPVVEIAVTDDTPIVRTVNPEFVDVFGYERDEIVGSSLNEFIVPPEANEEANRFDQRTAKGEHNSGVVTRITATGPREFLYRGVPYEQNGNRYAFAIYTDITERRQRKQELQREKERLNVFASSISHDLRSPLQAAIGRVEMLPETYEHKEIVMRSLERIEAIIDDGMEMVRIGSGDLEEERISVPALTRQCWNMLEPPAATLSVEKPFGVVGDRSRVQQLFENLFRNSLEHAGDAPTIRVGPIEGIQTTTRSDGSFNGFYVEDDGQGIPRERYDDIFDPGKTFNNGTGYGLAIVKETVDTHDWNIRVTSGVEGGARFEITDVETYRLNDT